MPKMTISMIDMYCDLVKEQFAPIIQTLKIQDNKIEEQLRIEVKKEFGIYDKMVRLAKLKLQIEELEGELEQFTKESHGKNGWKTRIDVLVDEKMAAAKNGFHKKVEERQAKMIYNIKLGGLDGETKKVFDELPRVIESLTKELKRLPPPTKRIDK